MVFVITTAMMGFGNLANAITLPQIKPNLFCNTVLPRATTKIQDRISTKNNHLHAIQNTQKGIAIKVSENRDAKLNVFRTEQNIFRTTQYEKLRALAKSDAQKQAVEKFITDVSGALSVRQQAIDSIIRNYRDGVMSVYESRNIEIGESLAKYKVIVDNALANAKNQCDSGTDGATVKAELKTAINNGHEKFKTDLEQARQMRIDRKSTIPNIKGQVSEATEAFKTAVAVAREELKKALNPGIPE